jgi:hypothetical protein
MAYTAIDDPSAYFQTTLYTGSGSSGLAITNGGNSDLQPDLLWISPRSNGDNNTIWDSSRTSLKRSKVNDTDAEDSNDPALATFESDGFDLDTTDTNWNGSSRTYVAWQWVANAGSSNASAAESGSNVAYNFQVNTTSKFMINFYTGTGSDATLNLGDQFTPAFLMIKNRSQADAWAVYHHKNTADPDTDYLVLDTTAATVDDATYWVDTNFAADEINIGTSHSVNADGENYICYAWAEVQGYSKFGSYTGNGNDNGPFVYTGFSPAWLMVKKTNDAKGWHIHDNSRPGYNPSTNKLSADSNAAEATSSEYTLDLLSNGFKLRSSDNEQNGDGETWVYAAFAHQPFVTSGGVPCTAR